MLTIILALVLLPSLAFNVFHFALFIRFKSSLEGWKERVDSSVVRMVMENDPELANKVVKTFNEIRGPYPHVADAMEAARRLHGLEP